MHKSEETALSSFSLCHSLAALQWCFSQCSHYVEVIIRMLFGPVSSVPLADFNLVALVHKEMDRVLFPEVSLIFTLPLLAL